VPNQKGQSLVNEWVGVHFWEDLGPEIRPFHEVLGESGLQADQLANPAAPVDLQKLEALIPEAVEAARAWMENRRDEVNDRLNEKLDRKLRELETLKAEHERQLDLEYADTDRPDTIVEPKKRRKRRRIERIFDDFFEWVENAMTIEEEAYIQVVAVLRGTG
jgi:uncharacterized protein YdaT